MKALYVTDLDGTLLNTKEGINEYSKHTINSLIEKGMMFTYATARSLSSASVVAQGISWEMPVIVCNGCKVVQPKSGEVIASIQFTKEEQEQARQMRFVSLKNF